MRLEGLIADFDDTLMATRRQRRALLVDALGEFGAAVDEQAVDLHWGKPFGELIVGLCPGIDYIAFHERYGQMMRGRPPIPGEGSLELLELLRRAGVPVIVVTSGSRSLVLQDLVATGMDRYIAALFASEDLAHQKPDPRTLDEPLVCLASLGVDPAGIECVGDSVGDYQIAKAKMIGFTAILSGLSRREEFQRAGLEPTRIVETMFEVPDVFRRSGRWLSAGRPV